MTLTDLYTRSWHKHGDSMSTCPNSRVPIYPWTAGVGPCPVYAYLCTAIGAGAQAVHDFAFCNTALPASRVRCPSALQLDLILFMDIRALLSALGRKLRAFARHRAATRLLRDAYADADAARLAASREECAICRDSMQVQRLARCLHHHTRIWVPAQQQESENCRDSMQVWSPCNFGQF